MKQILVMRHGKSDWSEPVSDFNRPLKKRGIKASEYMGQQIRNLSLTPEIIFSSPAKRAASTAEIFAKNCNLTKNDITFIDFFYETEAFEVFNFVRNIDNKFKRVMIVGHNPTLSDFVSIFTDLYYDMKTADIVVLESSVENWNDLDNTNTKAKFFFKHKNKD